MVNRTRSVASLRLCRCGVERGLPRCSRFLPKGKTNQMQRGKPRSTTARMRAASRMRMAPPQSLSARHKKTGLGRRLRCRIRQRHQGLLGSSLSPTRAARGPACGCPGSLPAIPSNQRSRPQSLSARHKKTGQWPVFLCLAEREGFEPSIELLTLYSLSRGAPSASRASLRICFTRTT